MGNGVSSVSPWSRTYEIIKENHDFAYGAIEEAITLEEQEKPNEAIEKYKEGILFIDKALDTPVTCPANPDFTWEKAHVMIQKMKKTRAEVLIRINCITSSPSFVHHEPPPSYEEATANASSTDIPRTYTDLAVALNNLHIESTNEPAEIIYTHDGVSLYFISPDGTVTKRSEPETLNIAELPGNGTAPRTIFLQIGDWIYPLVPGVSPCYRTDYGAFILPDVHSNVPGASVGIILPSDADASVYELLESILHGIISQTDAIESEIQRRMQREIVPKTMSETISAGIVSGAYYISQNLVKGAQKAGSFISSGTPRIMNSLTPSTEATPIPKGVSKGLEIASSASSTAAHFTGYVADKVGVATQALGRFLAPHVQRQGTKLLTSGFNFSEEEASSKVNGILTVAAGAVEGFSTIYCGLETSASILGNNLSNNTVKIVQHKYGSPAGQLASNTFNTMGNVISISHNSRFLTPKGFAKTAAKETGKALVQDIRQTMQQPYQQSNVYPNLNPMQQIEASTSMPALKSKSEDCKVSPQKK